VAAFPARDLRVLRAISLLAFLWPRPLRKPRAAREGSRCPGTAQTGAPHEDA
jgi:hypothetical protein